MSSRTHHPARSCLQATLLAAALTWANSTAAVEREWHVGGAGGAVWLKERQLGPGIGLNAGYGLADSLDLTALVRLSHHSDDPAVTVASSDLALTLKFDVVRWIPYLQLGAGWHYFAGDEPPLGSGGSKFGVNLGYGVDYLYAREFAIGLAAEHHLLWADGVQAPIIFPHLRFEYRWGF